MGKLIDRTGHTYGSLVVVCRTGADCSGKAMWACKCDCGKDVVVSGDLLKNGASSCGCGHGVRQPNKTDLIGYRSGRLLVTGFSHSEKAGNQHLQYWLVRCDCGTEKAIRRSDLVKSRPVLSCGCWKIERAVKDATTHGKTGSGALNSYNKMLSRCYNPKATQWLRYGGRGVSVCDRWKSSFQSFYADMGERPNGKTLDRIDGNGNYTPENCRWATQSEQMRNVSTNVIVSAFGMSLTIVEWAEKTGVSYSTLRRRIKVGWDIEKALTCPVKEKASGPEGAEA